MFLAIKTNWVSKKQMAQINCKCNETLRCAFKEDHEEQITS